MIDFSLKSIKEAPNLDGQRVFLRSDLNVPIKEGKVLDGFRLEKALPTINLLQEMRARVLLFAHTSDNDTDSLRPVRDFLEELVDIKFEDDPFSDKGQEAIQSMRPGEVILFENIRRFGGEEENDEDFSKRLSSLASIYVNDAFSASHRSHASIVGVPKRLPAYAGLLFEEEIKNLSLVLDPPHPFLFVLGGAKFDTKIPLINKFTEIADVIALGGAISTEFFEDAGLEIGRSLSSPRDFHTENFPHSPILLPEDLVVRGAGEERITDPSRIGHDERIMDIGPRAVNKIREIAKTAELILWNGPVGEYKEGYGESSLEVAKILAESQATTIIGGGDTLTVTKNLELEDKISYISPAGGAMLEFLALGTLPGIEALRTSK